MRRSELTPETLVMLYATLSAMFRHRLPPSRQNEVQDFVHETMIVLLRALDALEERLVRDPIRYALGIAVNKCHDALRENYRGREEISLDAEEGATVLRSLSDTASRHAMIDDEFNERLRSALGQLDAEERTFLRLRYFEGLDNRTASSRLGISPAEGSRLKWRALARLRFLMEGARARKERASRGVASQ